MAHELTRLQYAEVLPPIYTGWRDMDEIARVIQILLDLIGDETEAGINNQFILYANEQGIAAKEAELLIAADPTTETLEFRRARLMNRMRIIPIFSTTWVRQLLDGILGTGKYSLTIDYAKQHIYLRSSSADQSWYRELHITLSMVKPAAMVFVNQPLTVRRLKVSHTMRLLGIVYNYRLGTTWQLGQKSFADKSDLGVVKMPIQSSIQPLAITAMLEGLKGAVAKVRLNDTAVISTFTGKSVNNGVLTISYNVDPTVTGISLVTKVELLNASNGVLDISTVNIPIEDGAEIVSEFPLAEIV